MNKHDFYEDDDDAGMISQNPEEKSRRFMAFAFLAAATVAASFNYNHVPPSALEASVAAPPSNYFMNKLVLGR